MLYVPFVLSLSLARATAGTLGFSKCAKRAGHNNPLHPPKSVLLLTHQHKPQKGNHHVRVKARESQSVLPSLPGHRYKLARRGSGSCHQAQTAGRSAVRRIRALLTLCPASGRKEPHTQRTPINLSYPTNTTRRPAQGIGERYEQSRLGRGTGRRNALRLQCRCFLHG